ncbi:winged helix-turn-helix transcriptional regulator [bacterium]|nr:winged helix-turn-helix transcriptional regulator [bacterium]
MMDISRAFRILGNPTRLKILQLLLKGPHCVGKLAEKLNTNQPAITQHLRVLEALNLVKGERSGVRVHYAIDTEGLQALKEELQKFLSGLEIQEEACEDLDKCQE